MSECGGPNVNTDDIFVEWEHDRHDNIFTHRECVYKSKFTDQMASKPGKSWKESWVPRDYIGDEAADAIQLDEWMAEVGGDLHDYKPDTLTKLGKPRPGAGGEAG